MGREYTLDVSLARETAEALSTFERAYIETAFWLLTDDDGSSLDYLGLHDLSPEALASMQADCADFLQSAGSLLDGCDLSQAGHDFYLTRNRHGAGFWDRDASTYPNDPSGRALTALAHAAGETHEYVGDNGSVYTAR